MYWETKQFVKLVLLWYLLYFASLEPKLQCPQDMPVGTRVHTDKWLNKQERRNKSSRRITCTDSALSRGWSLNLLNPQSMERENRNLTVEKPGRHHCDQVARVNTSTAWGRWRGGCNHPAGCDEKGAWETSDQLQWRDILQTAWPVLLRTVRVMRNKGSLRNCHRPETAKETGWLNAVCAWMGLWDRKQTLGKNWWNPNKGWILVNGNYQCWFLSHDKCSMVA